MSSKDGVSSDAVFLGMKTPSVIYNTSSIEVVPSSKQLLIQTSVVICDQDKNSLETDKAKQILEEMMDTTTKKNGVVLEELKAHVTRADGMVRIQWTRIVNNYWEQAEKTEQFYSKKLEFNGGRFKGSRGTSEVLEIHLLHGLVAMEGELRLRETVVMCFEDDRDQRFFPDVLKSCRSDITYFDSGRTCLPTGFSCTMSTTDHGAKIIGVKNKTIFNGEVWKAGKRTEKFEDMKIVFNKRGLWDKPKDVYDLLEFGVTYVVDDQGDLFPVNE